MPIIRPDGTVLDTPGWDTATALLYEPIGGNVPQVSHSPTRDDAKAAAVRLLDLVCDFEFETEADRSAWLADLLTVISRPAIVAFVPLFCCHVPTASSGKSLLTDCVAVLAQGQKMRRLANPRDREETRKAVLSLVLSGATLVSMDNVAGTLGNDVIQKRRLGKRFGRPKLKRLQHIAIDEIHLGKRHRFLTLLLNLDSGAMVFVGHGKGERRLLALLETAHIVGGEGVRSNDVRHPTPVLGGSWSCAPACAQPAHTARLGDPRPRRSVIPERHPWPNCSRKEQQPGRSLTSSSNNCDACR